MEQLKIIGVDVNMIQVVFDVAVKNWRMGQKSDQTSNVWQRRNGLDR